MFKGLKMALAALVIAAAAGVTVYVAQSRESRKVETEPGRINKVEEMARLCTVEIYNEIPVRDTVNGKEIFAIQKQRGSVSFDMESLEVDDTTGDTVRVVLPPEIVELYEATEPDSWQVIDTKGLKLFTSDKLTAEEDNMVKRRIRERTRRLLYQNGTIERAREEGVRNLQELLEVLYRRPVVVSDPTPKGTYTNLRRGA